MNKYIKKAKPFATTATVAFGGLFILNSLANRFRLARNIRDGIRDGV